MPFLCPVHPKGDVKTHEYLKNRVTKRLLTYFVHQQQCTRSTAGKDYEVNYSSSENEELCAITANAM